MLLQDKVAVITGGAGLNGLGFATARQMAAQGAKVVILDLDRAKPADAAAQLGLAVEGVHDEERPLVAHRQRLDDRQAEAFPHLRHAQGLSWP